MADIDEAPAAVLPRELTGVAAAVRLVPAPPTPSLDAPYAIRLADPAADAHMVSDWMNRPHLVESWAYDWPPERWRRYLEAQRRGAYSRPFIASLDGEPIIYVELYRAARDSIASCYDADPHDIGVHAAIVDVRYVNRGIAPILLPRLVASLFYLEASCRRIMFDPDHRNAGARAVCEVAGAELLGELDMPNRRIALYCLARSADREGQ